MYVNKSFRIKRLQVLFILKLWLLNHNCFRWNRRLIILISESEFIFFLRS
jgi:hypothetical protein